MPTSQQRSLAAPPRTLPVEQPWPPHAKQPASQQSSRLRELPYVPRPRIPFWHIWDGGTGAAGTTDIVTSNPNGDTGTATTSLQIEIDAMHWSANARQQDVSERAPAQQCASYPPHMIMKHQCEGTVMEATMEVTMEVVTVVVTIDAMHRSTNAQQKDVSLRARVAQRVQALPLTWSSSINVRMVFSMPVTTYWYTRSWSLHKEFWDTVSIEPNRTVNWI
jgi:hypothetical protein